MSNTNEKRPRSVTLKGNPLVCTMCKGDRFYVETVKIDPMVGQILNLNRSDVSAPSYVCAKCKHDHWFLG